VGDVDKVGAQGGQGEKILLTIGRTHWPLVEKEKAVKLRIDPPLIDIGAAEFCPVLPEIPFGEN